MKGNLAQIYALFLNVVRVWKCDKTVHKRKSQMEPQTSASSSSKTATVTVTTAFSVLYLDPDGCSNLPEAEEERPFTPEGMLVLDGLTG